MTTLTRFAVITVSVLGLSAPALAQQPPRTPEPPSRDTPARPVPPDLDRLRENLDRLKANRERLKADKERMKADLARVGPEYTETFSKVVKIGQKGTLDLSNIAGDITVTAGGDDDAKIDAVKRVRGMKEADARAALQQVTIQLNERAGLLEVRTEFPRRGQAADSPLSRSAWSVDYTVKVPTGASVTLHTISGDVDVTGVKGDVTSNSVSGDVTVRNSRPHAIEIETVSGDLHLTGMESDRVQLRTVNGDIDYNGKLVRNGRYDMQSHSGDIRIVSPGSSGFDIEATTFNGDVKSDYPLTIRGTQGGNAFPGLPRMNRSMRGSFGDASAILTLRSFSGDIVIAKK